jgi:hypothetical protein
MQRTTHWRKEALGSIDERCGRLYFVPSAHPSLRDFGERHPRRLGHLFPSEPAPYIAKALGIDYRSDTRWSGKMTWRMLSWPGR